MAVLSLSLHVGFLHLQQVGATLQLWCTGFSLQWLLLLWTWAHDSAAKAGNVMMVVETSITFYQFKSNKRPQFRALSSP